MEAVINLQQVPFELPGQTGHVLRHMSCPSRISSSYGLDNAGQMSSLSRVSTTSLRLMLPNAGERFPGSAFRE
jgi:hypothetical protein